MGIEVISPSQHHGYRSVHHHNTLNQIYRGSSDFAFVATDPTFEDTEARFYKGSSDDFELMDLVLDEAGIEVIQAREPRPSHITHTHLRTHYTAVKLSDNLPADRSNVHHFLDALILYELNLIRNPADFERAFREWELNIMKIEPIHLQLDKKQKISVSKDPKQSLQHSDIFLFRLMRAKRGPYFLRDNLFDVCCLLLRAFPNQIQNRPDYEHGNNALVFTIRRHYQKRVAKRFKHYLILCGLYETHAPIFP